MVDIKRNGTVEADGVNGDDLLVGTYITANEYAGETVGFVESGNVAKIFEDHFQATEFIEI